MLKIASIFLVTSVTVAVSVSAAEKVVVIPLATSKANSCTAPDEVLSQGKCWKDRNLGASQVATSMTDTAAFGDLYQWGRLGDGHQNRNSDIIDNNSENDVPGHASFITETITPLDWRTPQNDKLWQGLSGINNPCPQGFRLPAESEWNVEISSWSSNDAAGAFSSPLKLVLAGQSKYFIGEPSDEGTFGMYWSSTVSGLYARSLLFTADSAGMTYIYRASGLSVRCIKN